MTNLIAATYGAAVTIANASATWVPITVTNGTAFTVNAPSSTPTASQNIKLTIEIINSSGGAMGAITWAATYVLVGGAFTNPATGKKRFISFEWNGVNWIETTRAADDY